MNDIVLTMLARLALAVVYQERRIKELEANYGDTSIT